MIIFQNNISFSTMLLKFFPLFVLALSNYGYAFRIDVKCNSFIVTGATQNCTAKIYDDNNQLATGNYRYYWKDDAIPKHEKWENVGTNIDTFNVTYNTSFPPGLYIIRVTVCHLKVFGMLCTDTNSNGAFFQITETLNGNLTLSQNNTIREKFVSTADEIHSIINLEKPDRDVVMKASSVFTYWFINCIYYGITSDFQFKHNFTIADKNHVIEALLMADFTPPTTTPLPTTTTTPNTNVITVKPVMNTKTVNSTAATDRFSTTTTEKPLPTTIKKKTKRSVSENAHPSTTTNSTKSPIKVWKNGTLVPYNESFPYVCNSDVVPTNKQHIYGYFSRSFTTQAPVSNISIVGNNWLQQWEVLDLDVKCQASSPIQVCLMYLPGAYNVTGNETCKMYKTLDRCEFPIRRFLQGETKYTLLIFFENEVSTKITPVTVTIYKVKQQAQLSVIVVPVAFSLVAVVTIVFGVAYYFQNRSRFIIEVADFDFGQQYTALEYKTFKDRLKDSIINTFTRDPASGSPTASTSSEGQIWPPGQKYTTMN